MLIDLGFYLTTYYQNVLTSEGFIPIMVILYFVFFFIICIFSNFTLVL